MSTLYFNSNAVKVKYISDNSNTVTKTYANVKQNVTAEELAALMKYFQNLTNDMVFGTLVTNQTIETEE